MNQHTIPFHIHAVLARNPGARVTTHLAPYERKRGYFTVAEVQANDGSLLHRSSGPSEHAALLNLDTSISLSY